jgi:hypothetical protein
VAAAAAQGDNCNAAERRLVNILPTAFASYLSSVGPPLAWTDMIDVTIEIINRATRMLEISRSRFVVLQSLI